MVKSIAIVIVIFLLGIVIFAYVNNEDSATEEPDISMTTLKLTSTAFENNSLIPAKYTCDGVDTSPPLKWSGVPKSAKSLVLIVDDPDAVKPAGKVWDHWVMWNIPLSSIGVSEGENLGTVGNNSGGGLGYQGPCPPDGEHRYFFKLFALDTMLDLKESSTKTQVERAMDGHIIDQAELVGRYERK